MEKEAEVCDGRGFCGGKEAALELRMGMIELAAAMTLIWSEMLLAMAEETLAQAKPKERQALRRAA